MNEHPNNFKLHPWALKLKAKVSWSGSDMIELAKLPLKSTGTPLKDLYRLPRRRNLQR
jgi:hypothetical protein